MSDAVQPALEAPDETPDVLAVLVAASVPGLCDDVKFDLVALDVSAESSVATDQATDSDLSVEHSRAPGCITLTVRSTPTTGVPAIEGTLTCTWADQARPTDVDVVAAGMLAGQAVAMMQVAGLTRAVQAQRVRTANLEIALASNREIGQAIGILMATEHITADEAFDQLRSASQHLHRKLREIAADVVETGALVTTIAPAGVRR